MGSRFREAITDTTRLKASICSYLQIHNKVRDDAKDYAKKRTEEAHKSGSLATDKEKEVVHYTDIIVDFRNKTIRGYVNLKADQEITLYSPARLIDASNDDWKEMFSFFDPTQTEHKKKLGEKVGQAGKKDDDDSNTGPLTHSSPEAKEVRLRNKNQPKVEEPDSDDDDSPRFQEIFETKDFSKSKK